MELLPRTDEEKLYVNESVFNDSRSQDESLEHEHVAVEERADDREDSEELYDEYMFDRDYEGYKFSFQELAQREKPANARNAKLNAKSILLKFLIFFLLCLFCFYLVIVITATTNEPYKKDAVLILRAQNNYLRRSTQFPMVIGLVG